MLEFPCKRFLNHGMTGTPKLLTEPEIAEILRCRVSEVARLRERGYLPYIYGKPILIDEADLLAVVGNSPLLTGAQVSRRLGITRDRLRYWRDTGRISCCPLPLSRTKYREEDLQAHFVAEEAKRVREAAIMVANEKFKAEQAAEKAKGKRLKPTPVQRKARRKAWFWAWISGGRSHLRHFPRIWVASCYGLIVHAGVKHRMTCGGWR